ncbi:hypothetical protein NP493_212g03020 [Ridgeia piscesae]|uniref:Uncharacterized protein n=1 Tax=Ridgeia piscesae TaxID=27915 RepID=A0AAD9P196_RIDPI|nr:hypothetical protein NP493_212g03020 [Ridgeia piscesae]
MSKTSIDLEIILCHKDTVPLPHFSRVKGPSCSMAIIKCTPGILYTDISSTRHAVDLLPFVCPAMVHTNSLLKKQREYLPNHCANISVGRCQIFGHLFWTK